MSYSISLGINYAEVDLGKSPADGDIVLTPTSGKTIVLIHASAEFDPNGGVEPNMSIGLKDGAMGYNVTLLTDTVDTGNLSNVVLPLNGRFLIADAQIQLSTADTWSGADGDANLKIRLFYMEV